MHFVNFLKAVHLHLFIKCEFHSMIFELSEIMINAVSIAISRLRSRVMDSICFLQYLRI